MIGSAPDDILMSVTLLKQNILEITEELPEAECSTFRTFRLVIDLTLEHQSMSETQCDSVAASVESLLCDAHTVQAQCRQRSEELSLAATQLRAESAALKGCCEAAQLDMAEVRRQLDELLDTKAAFEAKERQARKLSKHL